MGTKWRRVVSFTHLPLLDQGRDPRYPLCKRLVGPQSWSGRGGKEKKSLLGIEPGLSNPCSSVSLVMPRRKLQGR